LPPSRSLQDLMERRLAGLSDGGSALAEVAAVLGRDFALDLLLRVANLDQNALADPMKELVARQVLEEADGGRHRVVHDKLREAAFARIPEKRRRTHHQSAAVALEAAYADGAPVGFAVLAYHFREAKLRAKAIDYLERAGEEALASSSNRDAK